MNDKIRQLLRQITVLEDELRTALHGQETRMFFQINGKRVEFERNMKARHERLKRGIFRWIVTDRPQNFLTAPVIYGMAVPLLILDLGVSLYQAMCFPNLWHLKSQTLRLHRDRPPVFRLSELLRALPLHILRLRQWPDRLCGRDQRPHRAVFLPDQARPQGSSARMRAMCGFWITAIRRNTT